MPKDRVTQTHQGYGFVEFLSEDDADYAIKILNMIKLFGKPGFSFLLSSFLTAFLSSSEQSVITSEESGCWRQLVYWKSGPRNRREASLRYIFSIWSYSSNAKDYARS